MVVRNWISCPSGISHGNMIERTIFTKVEPENPGKEGTILKYIDSFSRLCLEPLVASVPVAHENIQEVFYVVSGKGTFEAGDMKKTVREGDGIIVPPGLVHAFKNELEEPLEVLLVVESVPQGVEVRKDALIRNYRERPLVPAHWTYLVHPIFGGDDGLVKIGVIVVRVEPMQTGDTHEHGPNLDEIWYMLKGNGIHVVSREICRQKPGDAVSVAPSTGHSLINDTDEPLQAFYFAAH